MVVMSVWCRLSIWTSLSTTLLWFPSILMQRSSDCFFKSFLSSIFLLGFQCSLCTLCGIRVFVLLLWYVSGKGIHWCSHSSHCFCNHFFLHFLPFVSNTLIQLLAFSLSVLWFEIFSHFFPFFHWPLTICCFYIISMDLRAAYGVVLRNLGSTLTECKQKGMRILVMLLLDTLPMLGNVLLLCFFVFFIFGIVGVQLWEGILRQRCVLQLPMHVAAPKWVTDFHLISSTEKKRKPSKLISLIIIFIIIVIIHIFTIFDLIQYNGIKLCTENRKPNSHFIPFSIPLRFVIPFFVWVFPFPFISI